MHCVRGKVDSTICIKCESSGDGCCRSEFQFHASYISNTSLSSEARNSGVFRLRTAVNSPDAMRTF